MAELFREDPVYALEFPKDFWKTVKRENVSKAEPPGNSDTNGTGRDKIEDRVVDSVGLVCFTASSGRLSNNLQG
jgi:hypothetical protein